MWFVLMHVLVDDLIVANKLWLQSFRGKDGLNIFNKITVPEDCSIEVKRSRFFMEGTWDQRMLLRDKIRE